MIPCITIAVFAIGSPPVDTLVSNDEARSYAASAWQHFEAKRYPEAARDASLAYAIDPNPQLLYAWAQAERLSGDCEAAVPLYDRFLDTDPPDPQAELARNNRGLCAPAEASETREPAIATTPSSESAADLEDSPPLGMRRADIEPPPPVLPRAPDSPLPDRRSVLRDPLGGVFLGSGAVAAIAGATLIGLALTWDDHTSADSLDEFSNARARARTQLAVGGALAGLGGVLLVGAATRYGVLARRSARLGVAATPKTVGITVGGRF